MAGALCDQASLNRDSCDYVQTWGKQAGAALHTSEEIGAIPSATRLCVSEFFRKRGLCQAALALAILAVAVLSDPSARTDRRAGLAPVDGRRLMALYYERIQSSRSDRMEEPARKCQPIGDFVWRSFQARSVCRTLKRGPQAWGQLYSHGIDDSSQFWQVPYLARSWIAATQWHWAASVIRDFCQSDALRRDRTRGSDNRDHGHGPSTETEPKPSNRRPRKLTCRSDSLPRVGPLAHRIERSYGVL